MKFILTQSNFLHGLSQVSPLAGRNPQLPVLQYVLLDARDGVLNLTCTDLEVGAHVVVGGKTEGEGSCVVPARQLQEYVHQLPSAHPITLALNDKGLEVATKGFTARFPVAEVDDFPLLPTAPKGKPITVDGRLLGQSLSRVVFAAARDETRPEIYSLYLVGDGTVLRIVATDSFRLAERTLPLEVGGAVSFLLPVATAQEVVRLFGGLSQVEVLLGDSHVTFRGDGVTLSSRLIEGVYPDYRQIIPSGHTTRGIVDQEELLRALKVLSVFLSRELRRIVVTVEPDKKLLSLQVEGGEAGQGEVGVVFDGEGERLETLFNMQYLLEGVSHMPGKKCELQFGGSNDPVMVLPSDVDLDYLYLVMPIQG